MRVIRRGKGRPKLSEEEVKSELFQMRLNKNQLDFAKEEAKKRGMNTTEFFLLGLSAYILWEAIRDKKK